MKTPLQIAVLYPEGSRLPCYVRNVTPGKSSIEIVLDPMAFQIAKVTARTEFALKVQQESTGAALYESRPNEAGDIVIGSLPPGAYQVHLFKSTSESVLLGRYILAPGECLNLGLLD